MDMVRFGRGIRALRERRRWRQVDLAAQARASQSIVSRVERGLGGRLTVEMLDRVAHALGSRVDVRLSWQGEGLDRLLDQDHARLAEVVTRLLRDAGWEVRTEVTFWVRGERGSVDVLGWHEASRIVLVIEIKSVVPDVQATLSTLDRKGRLGADIAATVGWRPKTVAKLLVIDASRTSRRRVAAHAATFEAALPHRFTQVRRYLEDPRGESLRGESLRGLIFVSGSPGTPVRHRQPSPDRRARA
jgi:transcriptional regulator with XRE-family HTH domain